MNREIGWKIGPIAFLILAGAVSVALLVASIWRLSVTVENEDASAIGSSAWGVVGYGALVVVLLVLFFGRQAPAFVQARRIRRDPERHAVVVSSWGATALTDRETRRVGRGFFARCLVADREGLSLTRTFGGPSRLLWLEVASVGVAAGVQLDSPRPYIRIDRRSPEVPLYLLPLADRWLGLAMPTQVEAQRHVGRIQQLHAPRPARSSTGGC